MRLALLLANKPYLVTAAMPAPVAGHRAMRAYEVLVRQQARALPVAMRTDTEAVRLALARLLGPATAGPGLPPGRKGDHTKGWTWNGHLLLLTEGDDYVVFRIIPNREAEIAPLKEADIALFREELRTRVEKQPNGDVLLRGMPNVPPGPRGFSSQALAESGLRYLGIPADSQLLGMQGFAGIDGVMTGFEECLRPRGLRWARFPQAIRPTNLKRSIDLGLPLLWSVWDAPLVEETINDRTIQRAGTADPQLWQEALKGWRKLAKRQSVPPAAASRPCWIVGYNELTDEIAISDCSGLPQRTLQWLTLPDVDLLSERDPIAVGF